MEEVVRVLLKRAAKNAPLRTTWSLPNVYPEDQGKFVTHTRWFRFPYPEVTKPPEKDLICTPSQNTRAAIGLRLRCAIGSSMPR